MSIYATWLMLDGSDHVDGCAVYVETEPGSFEFSGRECDCNRGMREAPIVYEGSHVLPSTDDRRGGYVEVGGIPDFIERDGRDDAQGYGLKDWLRIGIGALPSIEQYEGGPYVEGGHATVVLERRQVEELRDTLAEWLEREESS